MKIQVFGTDSDLCHALSVNAEQALKQLRLNYTMEKVTDLERIVGKGVMAQPALVIDGVIVASGKTPSTQELVMLISSLHKPTPSGNIPGVSDASSPCSTTELTRKEKESLKGLLAPEKTPQTSKKPLMKGVFLLLIVLSIGFTIMYEIKVRRTEAQGIPATEAQAPMKAHRLFVYFFHGNKRDESFSKLEEMTRKVIEAKYAGALSNGAIILSQVNLEDPANAQFVRDFQLTSPCIVLQKGARFEKLDAARNLMDDPDRFAGYVAGGIGKLK